MLKTSPFEDLFKQLGANFADYDGWRLPADFGHPQKEHDALAKHCAAFDLCAFGRISVKGDDAAEVITAAGFDITQINTRQQWMWAKTDTDCPIRIACLGDDFIILTMPSKHQDIIAKLDQIKIKNSYNVQIVDLSAKMVMLGLYGPQAVDAMQGVLPFEIDDLEEFGTMPVSVFLMNFIVIRGSWTKGDGLELLCPAGTAGIISSAIVKYHKKYHISPAGMNCLLHAIKNRS